MTRPFRSSKVMVITHTTLGFDMFDGFRPVESNKQDLDQKRLVDDGCCHNENQEVM